MADAVPVHGCRVREVQTLVHVWQCPLSQTPHQTEGTTRAELQMRQAAWDQPQAPTEGLMDEIDAGRPWVLVEERHDGQAHTGMFRHTVDQVVHVGELHHTEFRCRSGKCRRTGEKSQTDCSYHTEELPLTREERGPTEAQEQLPSPRNWLLQP